MSDLEKLNPKARVAQVGIRKIKEIQIYPLSFADEAKFIDDVVTAFFSFVSLPEEERTNATLITTANTLINSNLPKILSYVVDLEEINELFGNSDILSLVDNEQLLDIAQIVFEQNFGDSVQKKIQTMAKTWKTLFNQKTLVR